MTNKLLENNVTVRHLSMPSVMLLGLFPPFFCPGGSFSSVFTGNAVLLLIVELCSVVKAVPELRVKIGYFVLCVLKLAL